MPDHIVRHDFCDVLDAFSAQAEAISETAVNRRKIDESARRTRDLYLLHRAEMEALVFGRETTIEVRPIYGFELSATTQVVLGLSDKERPVTPDNPFIANYYDLSSTQLILRADTLSNTPVSEWMLVASGVEVNQMDITELRAGVVISRREGSLSSSHFAPQL